MKHLSIVIGGVVSAVVPLTLIIILPMEVLVGIALCVAALAAFALSGLLFICVEDFWRWLPAWLRERWLARLRGSQSQ